VTSPNFTNYDPTTDPTVSGWGGSDYDRRESGITHNIDTSVPNGAFASVRAPGWHKLGVVHTEQVSAETLLKSAHADYKVFKAPDFAHVERPWLNASGDPVMIEGVAQTHVEHVEDPSKNKLCRVHPVTGAVQVLGTCSPSYQPIDNEDAFLGFGDALIDVAEPNVSTCGVLYEGRQAFMCWKLPKDVLVGGVDASEWWLLVRTSHDLSVPLTCAITPLRTVCANTVRWNLRNAKSSWSIKHTRNAKLALTQAREALKLTYAYTNEWARIANELISVPLMPKVFDRIVTEAFGPGEDAKPKKVEIWETKRAELLHLFTQADTQDNIRNTAWAGVQTIGEFADWKMPVQVKGWDADGYRFWRSISGEKTVANAKAAALRLFADYAGVRLDAQPLSMHNAELADLSV
jgi:phage/plasmid-like protein (TIGR03299 family)